MSKQSFAIDASNIEAVKGYIRQQFEQRSWWPTEGPLQAKEDFERMQGSPEHVTEWCEKWLDGGQWRALEKAVPGAKGHCQDG